MSLDVVEGDHAIERPVFDFTFFVKARISMMLLSTKRLASDWAFIGSSRRYNNVALILSAYVLCGLYGKPF